MSRIFAALFYFLAGAITPAQAVDVPRLTQWYIQGLHMTPSDAKKLATSSGPAVKACRISIDDLEQLLQALVQNLGFRAEDTQQHIMNLAYQKVPPQRLIQFHSSLINIGVSKLMASLVAIELCREHVDPNPLEPLYKVLNSAEGGPLLPASDAQQLAVDLTVMGADSVGYLGSYKDAIAKKLTPDQARKAAMKVAVPAYMMRQEKRYAKDQTLHDAWYFQNMYGDDNWAAEWIAGPREKRTYKDGKQYRASEFKALKDAVGESWSLEWAKMPTSDQLRFAYDGKVHTLLNYLHKYNEYWQVSWQAGYTVPDQCAGLPQQVCDSGDCMWDFTGDPDTSCVVRPLQPVTKKAAAKAPAVAEPGRNTADEVEQLEV